MILSGDWKSLARWTHADKTINKHGNRPEDRRQGITRTKMRPGSLGDERAIAQAKMAAGRVSPGSQEKLGEKRAKLPV